MKRHVSAYLAIIRLQSSMGLSIVCVWQMLRSHHLAKTLYMIHKLRVSRYGGGCTLVCGILGGGYHPWALSLLVMGGKSGW